MKIFTLNRCSVTPSFCTDKWKCLTRIRFRKEGCNCKKIRLFGDLRHSRRYGEVENSNIVADFEALKGRSRIANAYSGFNVFRGTTITFHCTEIHHAPTINSIKGVKILGHRFFRFSLKRTGKM